MFVSVRLRFALLALLGAASSACSSPGKGAVTPEGYRSSEYSYSVKARPDGKLMGSEWKLDNFYGEYPVEKMSKDYLTKFEFDVDGDGATDTQSEQFVYDLRFKHLVHDGRVFVRTIPLSTDLG